MKKGSIVLVAVLAAVVSLVLGLICGAWPCVRDSVMYWVVVITYVVAATWIYWLPVVLVLIYFFVGRLRMRST